MKVSSRYPYLKVVFWFSVCPFLISGLCALLLMVISIFNIFDVDYNLFGRAVSSFPLAFFIFSLGVFYFPPAAILSVIYSVLKVKKNAKGVLFVSLSGALGAHLWNFLFFSMTERNIFPAPLLPSISLFMGFLSSLIIGVVALPKNGSMNGVSHE